MIRVTLRSLRSHKVRYGLTTLAVLLGVAFMAGTLVLTDTIGRTFDGLFADQYRSTAAVIRATQAYEPELTFANQRRQIDRRIANDVATVDGVTEVRIGISGYAQLVGRDGKAVGNPANGAPTLGETWNDVTDMNPYRLVAGGRPPRTDNEIAIDKHSADVGHLRVGDQVTVLTKNAPAKYLLVGVVRWETADSPLGASITLFTEPTAERVLGTPGMVDEVAVAAERGVSQQEMVSRLTSALKDPTLDIVTGATVTKEGQTSVRQALGFFNTFLLVFAMIALFVGAFLIVNTFSIVVAQRLRELALLRAVGASRRQIIGSVVGEAFVVGLVASVTGLVAGIGLAVVLRALLRLAGLGIPSTGLVVSLRTVVVCIVLGTVVTVLASIGPARRAGTIPPVAALREVTGAEQPRLLRRAVAGAGTTAVGLAALFIGLFSHVSNRLALFGVGAAVVFVGVAVLGPLFATPATSTLGLLVSWRGPTGRLARHNAGRTPRRTSSTAAALMVGVAVVSLMSVVATSTKASVRAVVEGTMRADLVVNSGGQNGGVGFSPALQQQLAALPEVASSTGVRMGQMRVGDSGSVFVLAADPRHVDDLFDVDLRAGSISTMSATGLAVSSQKANDDSLRLGSPVKVTFPTTGAQTFVVQAIYGARQLAGDYVLPMAAAEKYFPSKLDTQVYVRFAPGTSAAAGRAAVESVVRHYPSASLLDRQAYIRNQEAQVDQLLNLVYGLLFLALFIALVGIANTLALAVYERTHELGLLRAVGMTRGQLRATVRYESLLVALLGALEGLVIGGLLGTAVVAALHDSGVTRLAFPPGTLIAVTVLAAAAGVLAALPPSRRAARLDVLRAITAE